METRCGIFEIIGFFLSFFGVEQENSTFKFKMYKLYPTMKRFFNTEESAIFSWGGLYLYSKCLALNPVNMNQQALPQIFWEQQVKSQQGPNYPI